MKPSKLQILEAIDGVIRFLKIGGARIEGEEAIRIAETLGIARDFVRDKYRDEEFKIRRQDNKRQRPSK